MNTSEDLFNAKRKMVLSDWNHRLTPEEAAALKQEIEMCGLRFIAAEREIQEMRKQWSSVVTVPVGKLHESLNLIENTINGACDSQIHQESLLIFKKRKAK